MPPRFSQCTTRALVLGMGLPLVMVLVGRVCPAAEPPVTVENVRAGIQDTYKIGTWTAVRIDVKAGPEAIEATLELRASDSDGTPTRVHQPLSLAPGQSASFVLYTRPGSEDPDDLTVRVLNRRGRPLIPDAHAQSARPEKTPLILSPRQVMVVTLGNPQGVGRVPGLGAFTTSGSEPPLVVVAAEPRALPGRWYGLECASVLVIDTNDADALEAVRTRLETIRQWVQNGGHLVLAGGARGQEVRDLFGELLPAVPNGTIRLTDLGEIEAYAGSSNNRIPGNTMTVAVLEEAGARGGKVLSASASTPLVVRGAYGFGRVTLLGINVDQKPFADWRDAPLFWVRALDLKAPPGSEEAVLTSNSGGAFYQKATGDLAGQLFQVLDRPPGVVPIPFGWVAFLVFVYILLIGPGDYFFLKRVLKRMELTWLTFPLLVVVTSGVAYLAAYRLKGTDLKVVKADVVDIDQLSGRVRGSSWITLFSPENWDYNVSIEPKPIAGDGAGPRAGVERLVSWFGSPDAQLGGGGTQRLTLGASPYDYRPDGQMEGLAGARIPMWSTKSFYGRWTAPLDRPLIEADLVPTGFDRLEGSITNTSNRPLQNAALLFGGQVYDQIGTIEPGMTVQIDLSSRTRPLSGFLEDRAVRLAQATGSGPVPAPVTVTAPEKPAGPSAAADLLYLLLFRNGMSPKTEALPSAAYGSLDLTGLLELERPILVASVTDSGADLVLDEPPRPPRTDQTTLVRILLPLKKEP